jgi:hypothetical protein
VTAPNDPTVFYGISTTAVLALFGVLATAFIAGVVALTVAAFQFRGAIKAQVVAQERAKERERTAELRKAQAEFAAFAQEVTRLRAHSEYEIKALHRLKDESFRPLPGKEAEIQEKQAEHDQTMTEYNKATFGFERVFFRLMLLERDTAAQKEAEGLWLRTSDAHPKGEKRVRKQAKGDEIKEALVPYQVNEMTLDEILNWAKTQAQRTDL